MTLAASATHRAPLNTARIVDQAVGIADEHGVSALSMRSLARSLGFEVMALYNHVANKQELLSLMTDAVAGTISMPPPDAQPADVQPPNAQQLDAVRALAISTRAALLEHPWATDQWQRHLPGPARTNLMETLLRLLNTSGLSPKLAHSGFHAVTNHVIGYTLQESSMVLAGRATVTNAQDFLAGLSAETYPHMVAHVHHHLSGETESSFELVLDFILDGLVKANH